jgi:flagellum-specific ATP synthase
MQEIVSPRHLAAARQLRQVLATYNQSRELVAFGAWKPGGNPALDQAVSLWPGIERFLQQDLRERADLTESLHSLESALTSRNAEVPTEAAA